jgi:hypothetical protein
MVKRRLGVAGQVSSYFLKENRDLGTAIGKICANNAINRFVHEARR